MDQEFNINGITSISSSSLSSCSLGLMMPAFVDVDSSIVTSSLSVACKHFNQEFCVESDLKIFPSILAFHALSSFK